MEAETANEALKLLCLCLRLQRPRARFPKHSPGSAGMDWSPVPDFGLIQHLQLQLGQMPRALRAGDPPRVSLAVLCRVSTGAHPRL